MKKSLLLLLFVIVTNVISSQIITVSLDTTQFFEHSALISTPQAIKTGKLVYKDLYEHKTNLSLTFDLGSMVE